LRSRPCFCIMNIIHAYGREIPWISRAREVTHIADCMFWLIMFVVICSGSWITGKVILRSVLLLLQLFVWPITSLKKYGANQGAWAVVTGCTDGIGREFAFQLAEKGFNIVLVSRNPDKLAKVATEIESKIPGILTMMHAIDFVNANEEDYAALEASLVDVPVAVLVNNVGVCFDIPVPFSLSTTLDTNAIVKVNCIAPLRVTSFVLPAMIKRRSGLILNIGSFASSLSVPLLSTYGASKSFLLTWSQAIGDELCSSGVNVQWVNSSWVVPNLSKFRIPSIIVPSAYTFVCATLSRVGVPCGSLGRRYASTPYWPHALMDFGAEHFPFKTLTIKVVHWIMQKNRRRALRRRKQRGMVSAAN